MRIVSFLVGFACLIAALSFTVWVGGGSAGTPPNPRYNAANKTSPADPSPVTPPEAKAEVADPHAGHDHGDKKGPNEGDRSLEEAPPVSKSGPYPKVEVEHVSHSFGVMEPQVFGEHVFKIKNTGEADLSLRRGASTCQCTRFDILKKEVPPGETADVVVNWKPKDTDRHFEQSLELFTNDPQRSKIKLTVHGLVEPKLVLMPTNPWNVGTYAGSQNSNPHYGTITSRMIDDFKVESVEIPHPERMTVNVTPLPEDDPLIAKEKYLSGVRIELIMLPEVPIGAIKEKVILHTNVPGHEALDLGITGFRTGPIRVYPTQGVRYDPDRMHISLGRFPSTEGKKVQLRMLVSEMEGEFEISDIQTEPGDLKMTVEKDKTDFADPTRQRFLLTFEIPPGLSRARTLENVATVKFRTNHPQAKEMTFQLDYVAL